MRTDGDVIHSPIRGILSLSSCLLVLAMWIAPAFAEGRLTASVGRGALLVANPSMEDPNFQHTVLLILEHGRNGTIGVVLNRMTEVLLSEVLPDLVILRGTPYRLFTGGPVERRQLVLLFRLTDPRPDTRSIVDGIYMGTPTVLERMLTQPRPAETFRAFSGFAGWAPGQLEQELLEEAWSVLSADALNIFDKDPATLWKDAIRLLQVPRSISHERQGEISPGQWDMTSQCSRY